MPKVSVIMPAYNAKKTVKAAISSVLRQSFADLELIVINDGSEDGTDSIVASLAAEDSRIIYLKNEKNLGASYTRNRGVELARGEWIAFLDSDDLWREDKLERQMALAESNPEMKLCYTASAFMGEDGEKFSYVMPAKEKITYGELLCGNIISCSSVMIRASLMKRIKMPSDKMHEDYYVWLTVMKDGTPAYGINEPLLIYRISPKSKSGGRLRSAKMLYNSYRAVGFGIARSALLVTRYTFYSIKKRNNIRSSK